MFHSFQHHGLQHARLLRDSLSLPLSLCFPPAYKLSQHQLLFHELGLCIRWPKYWSFSFSISRSNEHSGLISFSIDCFYLLPVQGTFRSPIQHHTTKASFFGAQPYLWYNSHIHTWLPEKTMALTIRTYVSKVMSLLFNMLSKFVIAFLPRITHLLISWCSHHPH